MRPSRRLLSGARDVEQKEADELGQRQDDRHREKQKADGASEDHPNGEDAEERQPGVDVLKVPLHSASAVTRWRLSWSSSRNSHAMSPNRIQTAVYSREGRVQYSAYCTMEVGKETDTPR